MSSLKSGVKLEDGENLVMELEAELWATSGNPIARLFGGLKKLVWMILGHRRKGFVVITDKRVVEVINVINCYVFNVGRIVKYVLPSSVKEVGYKKIATWGCCCPAYYFYYEGHTEYTEIQLKGADEAAALKVVDAFYSAIAKAQG